MPEKFDRCVQHVKEQGGKVNPYAVCRASLGKEFTKEDTDKLGQILKELNEMKSVLKGGEGSGQKGHKTDNPYIDEKGRDWSPKSDKENRWIDVRDRQEKKEDKKSKEDPFKQFNDAKAASKMKPVKPIKIRR